MKKGLFLFAQNTAIRLFSLAALLLSFFVLSPTPQAQAGGPVYGWSQGMFTRSLFLGQLGCTWYGEHCRLLGTGLPFDPNLVKCPKVHPVSGRCFFFKKNGAVVTNDVVDPAGIRSRDGNIVYWGVSSWVALWTWQTWSFSLVDGATW